ncbi:hypothetical protein WH52_03155 [Tenacibaculum holothuriorum]|uniref:DUF547 domain-containing protein n=1 Tax=Tenacibaculum holothuriorum TaxID=1635173 RepID=A0A1Y2PEX7_9FLAO|nr:DUF547 domain-containing protein [Tenacibaculum holothuriorum]OSY89056.1 hypothetical protein WH52_03155 [Tenacibaculum holothuriorum]
MRKIIILLFFFLATTQFQAQNKVFDALLKTYVDSKGNIDYKGLRKNRALLDIYLDELKKTVPRKNWSSNKAKAFWMNAYNAYTIKLVLDSYPLKKITDIQRKGRNAWKIPFAEIGKKKYSLDFIEHKILRRWHDDPRIHVGINAASKSGPKFPNYAFTEKNVNSKLEMLMKDFINDSSKNKITVNKVEVSKVFEWYQEDFTSSNTLVDYINKYSNVKANDNAEVVYLEYDWHLNDKK